MKRKIQLLLLLLSAITFAGTAQNNGFGGKRFLIKTDILNGVRNPMFSISAEFLATRSFTLTAGYRYTHGKYNQIFFESEYPPNPGSSYSSTSHDNKMPDKAEVSSQNLMLEARLYVSGVVPAPRGSFVFASYNYGTANVTGNFYQSVQQNLTGANGKPVRDSYYTYKANNVVFWGIEGGWGYQSFINKYLTLGVKLGLNKTFFNADNQYESKPLSGVAKTFGPNLLRLAPLDGLSDLSPIESENSSDPYRGSFGAVFYLQLGVLLF